MKRFITAIAFILMSVPAFAKDAKSVAWTGCHVGAHVGYSSLNTDANIDVVGFPVSAGINGLGASGGVIGAGVGCDIRIPSSDFVVGAFGDWTRNDLDHSASLTLGGLNASAKYSLDDAWTIGARAGYLVTESTLVYGLAGYTVADTSPVTGKIDGLGSASFSVGDLKGWTLGGGIEVNLTDGLFLKGEYRYTMYDGESVALVPGLVNLNLDTDEHSARVGLLYRFGM